MSKLPLDRLYASAREFFQRRLNDALAITHDIQQDELADLELEIRQSHEDIEKLKAMLKSAIYDQVVRSIAEDLVAGAGVDDQDAAAHREARKLAARAQLLLHTFVATELSGETYDGAPSDAVFRNILPNMLPAADIAELAKKLTVQVAVDMYVEAKQKDWVPKTAADQRRVLYFVRDIIGDERELSSLAASDVRAVRDTLQKVPKHALKSAVNRDRKLLDIIHSGGPGELLSAKTTEKYFEMFRSFLNWAVNEEYLDKMPGIKIAVPRPSSDGIDERDPYSTDQLIKIFSSPLYVGCKSLSRRSVPGNLVVKDGLYWVPLIGLFSGMRLGEIVQLRTGDVKAEDGIAFFDVTLDEGTDKSLKTVHSKRKIPVHSKLIDLGFLGHVENVKGKGHSRVLSDIDPDSKGYYSGLFSKTWSYYTKKIGVHSRKAVFHSFRHNFTDALREADVPDDVSRALTGHAKRGDRVDTHLRYGSKASLKRLKAGVDKVAYLELDTVLASLL